MLRAQTSDPSSISLSISAVLLSLTASISGVFPVTLTMKRKQIIWNKRRRKLIAKSRPFRSAIGVPPKIIGRNRELLSTYQRIKIKRIPLKSEGWQPSYNRHFQLFLLKPQLKEKQSYVHRLRRAKKKRYLFRAKRKWQTL